MNLSRNGLMMSSLAAALCFACASQTSTLRADAGRETSASPHSDVDATRRDMNRLARERLDAIEKEMVRVARRLDTEGTPAQRAQWGRELSDIEHDRKLLGAELRDSERASFDEWADTHGMLTSLIDVLAACGTKAAVQIDRSLDEASSADAATQTAVGPDLCSVQ
jgi:hypothetical protein